jgi:hypothetical protein
MPVGCAGFSVREGGLPSAALRQRVAHVFCTLSYYQFRLHSKFLSFGSGRTVSSADAATELSPSRLAPARHLQVGGSAIPSRSR